MMHTFLLLQNYCASDGLIEPETHIEAANTGVSSLRSHTRSISSRVAVGLRRSGALKDFHLHYIIIVTGKTVLYRVNINK